ncbi:MAG: hypothetical protein ABI597_06745 [Gammaproteobacteria bacterium]
MRSSTQLVHATLQKTTRSLHHTSKANIAARPRGWKSSHLNKNILPEDRKAYPTRLILLLILASTPVLTKFFVDFYDEYSHGETQEQFKSRKMTEKPCVTLKSSTPESYKTTRFLAHEETELQKCKEQKAKQADILYEKILQDTQPSKKSSHRVFGK